MKTSEMLLIMRQNFISVTKKYEMILLPIIKFAICFVALNMLKEATGYTGALGSIVFMGAISLVGAFCSAHGIEVCSILLSVLFILPSNPIMAMILFVALAIIYMVYGRLFPGESLLIIITLIAFSMHLELLVPIIAGLVGSYVSVIAIIIGTMMWFILPELRGVLPSIKMEKSAILEAIEQLLAIDITSIVSNQAMLVIVIIFFIVFSTVFLINRLPIDYGPYIAIGIGSIMNVIGFGLATVFFVEIEINLLAIILETILFSVIAVIVQFLSKVLDYQRAENVRFEDDDNYYYVRIIPKIKINFKENKIKKVYTDPSHTNHDFKLFGEDDGFHSNL